MYQILLSVLNFVDAFCLNIRAGSVIGRSLCKTQIKSPNTSKCGEFVENISAAGIALQLVDNAPINSKLQHPPPPQAYPGHLTMHRARGEGNLNVVLEGWGI